MAALNDIKPLQPSWPIRPLKRDERERRQPGRGEDKPPQAERGEDEEGTDDRTGDHLDEYA